MPVKRKRVTASTLAAAESKRRSGMPAQTMDVKSSQPIGTRPKKLLETLNAVLADGVPADVLSIIASYDREAVLLFVDESGDFTVWSLNENQSVTQRLYNPADLNEADDDDDDDDASDPFSLTLISLPPLAGDKPFSAVAAAGGFVGLFVYSNRDPFSQFWRAVAPLRYELASGIATHHVPHGWEYHRSAAACALPRSRVLVTCQLRGKFQQSGNRMDNFHELDALRGKFACIDAHVIRSTQPQLIGALRLATTRLAEVEPAARGCEKSRPALAALRDDLRALIATHPPLVPPNVTLAPASNARAGATVNRLLPLPLPYEHVVVWASVDASDRNCCTSSIGIFDTESRTDIGPTNQPPTFHDCRVSHMQWIVTPSASASASGAVWLSLFVATNDDGLYYVTSQHPIQLNAAADPSNLKRWIGGIGGAHKLTATCGSAEDNTAEAMAADGTGRIVTALYDTSLTLLTPRCVAETGAMTEPESREFRRRTAGGAASSSSSAKRAPQPALVTVERVAFVDSDCVAVASESQIRIWDLSAPEADGTYQAVELTRGSTDSKKKIIHLTTL